jgi:hypothetical protein
MKKYAATTGPDPVRKVNVTVTPSGSKPTKFEFAIATPTGRAAKFLQAHHPIDRVLSHTEAELKAGGSLTVEGCSISDLYPNAVLESPLQPEPSPLPSKRKLQKLALRELLVLAKERNLDVSGVTSKKSMIGRLVTAS